MAEESSPQAGRSVEAADVAAEIERLRTKQSAVDDEDIRLAIQARIDTLETELKRQAPVEPVAEEEEEIVPPTAEQSHQADGMIRQARVEKMRGNSARATTLMKEAAAIAPTSPAVLEALGDDLVERRMYKDAMAVYKRAFKLAPLNIGIETKIANTSLKASGMGSIEQQLRMGDSAFISQADAVASTRNARVLNAFMPGVGHMVLGRTAVGIGFVAVWVVCIVLVILMHKDLEAIFRMVAGKEGHPNMVVLLPLFVAIVTWISAQAALGVSGGGRGPKGPIDRPKPPVDLPFE